MIKKFLLAAFVTVLFLSACKKQTDDYKMPEISEYLNLTPGKYIVYQCDSIRFGVQGSLTTKAFSYQVKYEVDSLITDNIGRPGYRIYRYIRDTTTKPWVRDYTCMAIIDGSSYEFVENNFRYVKLKQPFNDGFSWKGNAFINTTSDDFDYGYLKGWDYTYDSVGAPLTLGSISLDNTLKVAQIDQVDGFPDDVQSYSEINYGAEYYAKGIGLVYKKLYHSEYQPPDGIVDGHFVTGSFGVTLTMIDHN